MTTEELQNTVDALFAAGGIKQVVVIDDEYREAIGIEEIEALNSVVPAESVEGVFADIPELANIENAEVRGALLRRKWGEMEPKAKQDLRMSLIQTTGTTQAEDDTRVDVAAVRVLEALLGKHNLRRFSLKKWVAEKDPILVPGMPATLLLIDENFSKEGGSDKEGRRLIREVLNAVPNERVMCALVSHNYGIDKIHDDWNIVCEEENLSKSKFVLIPKKMLTQDTIGAIRLMKLAMLNSSCTDLIEKAVGVLNAGQKEALERLKKIDIYEFDQIVFRSSKDEGVWEPDTLFRLFGAFHRDESRVIARADSSLRALADSIRSVSQVRTDSKTAPTLAAWKIQRSEIYESGSYVNSLFLPIELGDIFQRTGLSSRRYILLGQPCDLMVRSDGKRDSRVNEVVLAQVNTHDKSGAELPFFDGDGTKSYYVDFKSVVTVKLCVMDLCVFNPDGNATIAEGSSCDDAVIPAWKERHVLLKKEVVRKLGQYGELTKAGMPSTAAKDYLFSPSNVKIFNSKLDAAKRVLSYDFQRVERLRQPRSSYFLTQYAAFVARGAFDHDYQKRASSQAVDAEDIGKKDEQDR